VRIRSLITRGVACQLFKPHPFLIWKHLQLCHTCDCWRSSKCHEKSHWVSHLSNTIMPSKWFSTTIFFTCIKSQLFCAVLNRNSNTTPSSVNSAINKFSFRFMVVYYEGWRTVILKSVETNQLIRVSLKKEPIYKLLHLLGLEKTPIFYNDAPCGWAVHWRKSVLCIRKERKKEE